MHKERWWFGAMCNMDMNITEFPFAQLYGTVIFLLQSSKVTTFIRIHDHFKV
jgi:hypothetical protein